MLFHKKDLTQLYQITDASPESYSLSSYFLHAISLTQNALPLCCLPGKLLLGVEDYSSIQHLWWRPPPSNFLLRVNFAEGTQIYPLQFYHWYWYSPRIALTLPTMESFFSHGELVISSNRYKLFLLLNFYILQAFVYMSVPFFKLWAPWKLTCFL